MRKIKIIGMMVLVVGIVCFGFSQVTQALYQEDKAKKQMQKEGLYLDEQERLTPSSISQIIQTGKPEDLKKITQPEYAPGEVIVKFKPDIVNIPLEKQEVLASEASINVSSIRSLNQKYGLIKIKRVFKPELKKDRYGRISLMSPEEQAELIRKKFPQRASRAPKDAKVPDLTNIYKLTFSKEANVMQIVEAYKKDPNVEYTQPNYKVHIFLTPSDPYYSSYGSWGQDYGDMWGLHKIQMGDAWDTMEECLVVVPGGPQGIVAVIDTGVDYNHPELDWNIWRNADEIPGNGIDDDGNGYIDDTKGWDFVNDDNDPIDNNGHGTHCSGTIAAEAENGEGIAGIAWHRIETPGFPSMHWFNWRAKIMPVKGLDDEGFGYDSDLANCIKYAADNGADVLSMSWGGYGACPELLRDALDTAYGLGCVLVTSAGNDDADAAYFHPANYENAITVAATDPDDKKASFSNWGTTIDVSAPGVDILSLRAEGTDMYEDGEHIVGEKYYRSSGTSMACPHVAGLISLIFSKNPTWSSALASAQITHTTDDIDLLNPHYEGLLGSGRINAYKALTTTPEPDIIFKGYQIDDTAGNDNGLVEPGETVNLSVRLKNTWQDATNVTVTLTTTDSYITITDDTFSFRELPSGMGIWNLLEPYVFTVDSFSPTGRRVIFTLDIEADGGYFHSETFNVPISIPMQSGWPKIMDSQAAGSPTLIDIDEDGASEVVVTSKNKVYVWRGDGTGVIETDGGFAVPDEDDILRTSPALGDIDGDGDIEIVVGASNGKIYAWYCDGTRVDGWPVTIVTISDPIRDFTFSEITLEDIDKDGACEILFEGTTWYEGESPKTGLSVLCTKIEVYVLEGNGDVIWSDVLQDGPSFAVGFPLSVGDINGGGDKEIVANIGNKTTLYYPDGKIMDGWPVVNRDPYYPDLYAVFNSAPIVGDFDGGSLEIMTSSIYMRTDGLSIGNFSKICVWHSDTTEVSGWPVKESTMTCMMDVYPPIHDVVLGDIDGDGNIEVIAGGIDGLIYAWENDGTQIVTSYSVDPVYYPAWPAYPGWERPCPAIDSATSLSSPVLGDIDGDGDIEIMTVTANGKLCALHHNGALVEGFPIEIDGSFAGTPALGDIDGDGDIEIIVVSGDGKIYAWDCSGEYDHTTMEWPMFRHDPQHTGYYASPNHPPILDPIDHKTIDEGQLLEFKVTATDPDGDELSYSASNLPKGASFNPATKTFSWRPDYTQAGTYKGVHFEVSDGELTDSEDITIVVNDVNRPPTSPNITGPGSGFVKQTLTFTAESSDPDGDLLHLSFIFLGTDSKEHLVVISYDNPATQIYSWDKPGSYYIKVKAEDDKGGSSDWARKDITIEEFNQPPYAKIVYIWPNLAQRGQRVYFSGKGYDKDGRIVAYHWRSSIDGFLSERSSFSTNKLSSGIHTIYFKVKDDKGAWSKEVERKLFIRPRR